MARSFGIEVDLLDSARSAGEMAAPAHRRPAGRAVVSGRRQGEPGGPGDEPGEGREQPRREDPRGCPVSSVNKKNGFVSGVETSDGPISCEIVVNCAGQWARALGARDGVNIPLHSAEHFYIVTEPIEGVHPMLPVMRDPDGFIYFKEEVGGLVMGGFEPVAKPWGMDGIPDKFEFQLLPEDWDQFQPLMEAAMHRVPALETAGVKMLLNGPESFTPDGNFILGEAPEMRNYFVAAGFNSAGIANAGGAGKLLAEWIAGGEAPMDLFEVDVRRFGAFAADAQWLKAAHGRDARPALRHALAAPRARIGPPAAGFSSVRETEKQRRPVRLQVRLGARQLLRPEDAIHARPPELARRGDRRAAGDPKRGRHPRPDLVRQAARARARRRGAARPRVREPHRTSSPTPRCSTARAASRATSPCSAGRTTTSSSSPARRSRCATAPGFSGTGNPARTCDSRRRHRRVVGDFGPRAAGASRSAWKDRPRQRASRSPRPMSAGREPSSTCRWRRRPASTTGFGRPGRTLG